MHGVNKATRAFIKKNQSTIENSFINEGLIEYELSNDFEHY